MSGNRYLFITTHNPFSPVGGAQQRTRLLFDALCRTGHTDLVCFTEDPTPAIQPDSGFSILYFGPVGSPGFSRKRHIFNMLRIWSPYALYARDALCEKVIRDVLAHNKYNCIVSRYLEPVFICGLHGRKDLVIDADDALDELYRSYYADNKVAFTKRMYYYYRTILLKLYGSRLYRNALHVFFSNDSNATYPNASCLPNIPYIANVRQDILRTPPRNHTMIFVGTMSYPPNYLGVDVFIENVWPGVSEKIPNAKFIVYGKGTPDAFQKKWQAIPGITVAGFADDLAAAYQNTSIVVVPVYHGAGTNIKILEAMYCNRSCIISSLATRGLEKYLIHRNNLMIADSFEEFANHIIELLESPELDTLLRNNAAKTINENFSSDVFYGEVEMMVNKLTTTSLAGTV
jgi:glycosyltransferase involved in cell wall biosynthesis